MAAQRPAKKERSRFRAEYLLLALLLVAGLFPDEVGRWAHSVLPMSSQADDVQVTARVAVQPMQPPTPTVSSQAELRARPQENAPGPVQAAATPVENFRSTTNIPRAQEVPGTTIQSTVDVPSTPPPLAGPAGAGREGPPSGAGPLMLGPNTFGTGSSSVQVFSPPSPAKSRLDESTPTAPAMPTLNAESAAAGAAALTSSDGAFEGRITVTMPAVPGVMLPPMMPIPLPVGAVVYVGPWIGSYSGSDSGTFQVIVATTGLVSGQGQSKGMAQVFPVSGVVDGNGRVTLTRQLSGALPGARLEGVLRADQGEGSWSSGPPLNFAGTWRLRRTLTQR